MKPVFFDLGGKRWPRARRLVALLGRAFVPERMVFFVQSLFVPPVLVLPLKLKKLKEQLSALQKKGPAAPDTAAANANAVREFYPSAAGQEAPGAAPGAAHPKERSPAACRPGRSGSAFDGGLGPGELRIAERARR